MLNKLPANPKYELTDHPEKDENGFPLYRIRALRNVCYADRTKPPGTYGGLVSGHHNLSHDGACWIDFYARVVDDGHLHHDSQALDHTIISGNARLSNRAKALGRSRVGENASIREHGKIEDDASAVGDIIVKGYARAAGRARLRGQIIITDHSVIGMNAEAFGFLKMFNATELSGNARAGDEVEMYDGVKVTGNSHIKECATLRGFVHISGMSIIGGNEVIESSEYARMSSVSRVNWNSSGRMPKRKFE